tara:strand:- start:54 stop:422 length:369 start_codon:yes stop_codon:yes gene_type:complete
MIEPYIVDYYCSEPYNINVIDKMNDEYQKKEEENEKLKLENEKLKLENEKLKNEIDFLKLPFENYKLRNTAVFNIIRAKKLTGEDIWFNKIDPYVNEEFLKSLEQTDYIKDLLKHCNPRCER